VKARCLRILVGPYPTRQYWDAGPEAEASEHPGITVGNEYVVTHIKVGAYGHELGIINDDGVGSQWPAVMFETTSTRIPSNWTAAIDEDGILAIAPGSWLVPGFWGDAYAKEPWTSEQRIGGARDYREQLAIIVREA
jgi:hypothetical protein